MGYGKSATSGSGIAAFPITQIENLSRLLCTSTLKMHAQCLPLLCVSNPCIETANYSIVQEFHFQGTCCTQQVKISKESRKAKTVHKSAQTFSLCFATFSSIHPCKDHSSQLSMLQGKLRSLRSTLHIPCIHKRHILQDVCSTDVVFSSNLCMLFSEHLHAFLTQKELFLHISAWNISLKSVGPPARTNTCFEHQECHIFSRKFLSFCIGFYSLIVLFQEVLHVLF